MLYAQGVANELTRVTLNLTPRASDSLNILSEMTRLSKTDVINRALQVYELLERHTQDGGAVQLVESGGRVLDLRIL